MKRSIVFSFLLVLLTSSILASTTEISLFKDPTLPGPKPLSESFIPVSASISETELSVYFDLPVGYATITVYDADNKVVYQENVDNNTTTSVFVASDNWSAGNYTLTISYGKTYLIGDFVME